MAEINKNIIRAILIPFIMWMIGKDCDMDKANQIVDKYFKQTTDKKGK